MKRLLLLTTIFAMYSASAAEYIIKFKNAAKLQQKALNVKGVGQLNYLDTHTAGSIAKVEISNKSKAATAKALAAIMKSPDVEYVVESFKLHTLEAPMDASRLKEQWANTKVEAQQAWALAGNQGSQGVTIAVIDTGVDYRHESLKDNMVPGYDFFENDNDPFDDYDPNWQTSRKNPGHGTHCAGTAGATGLVDQGVIGLSPKVSIMPLRFLNRDGSGDLMAGIKAIDYAIEKKVDVISASWGAQVSASQAQPLIDAVKRASDAGVLFVAAAGNGDQSGNGLNNDNVGMYPANANFENTITVAASDQADAKTTFSNFGRKSVHVAAPGLKIMSTLPDGNYNLLSGTSMATPLVSGLAALIKAQNKALTGMQISSIMQQTGNKAAIEVACNCRVNANASIDAVVNSKAVLVPYSYTLPAGSSVKFAMLNASGAVNFESSDAAVASFGADGTLTANKDGEVKVTATDATGTKLTSESVYVWTRSGGGGGGGEGCPLDDPAMCDILCQINPSFPWCSK